MIFDYTEVQMIKEELLATKNQIEKLLKSDLFYKDNIRDKEEEKIAVYSVTSNCFDFLRVSIKSLLYNSDVDKVIVISDSDELPSDFPKDIINVPIKDAPEYIRQDGPNSKTSFRLHCLLKVALHKVLTQYDKVLLLDYDTIVRKDISDLWDIQLGDRYYLAGVPEINRTRGSVYGYFPKRDFKAMSNVIFKRMIYVNAGVLLLNLRKLRDDGAGDEMIDRINENEYALPEQDVINEVCHRNIYLLPDEYNSNHFGAQSPNPKIIHYAAQEKKLDYEDVIPFRDMPWTRIKEHRELDYRKTLELGDTQSWS